MTSLPKIRFVVGTRTHRQDFFQSTALGRSLALYRFSFLEVDLYESNTQGLPRIYNQSIDRAREHPAILIFAHDDIHLTDFYWVDKLVQSLANFDVVGVAGNKRRLPMQPAWAFVDQKLQWDARENLSGVVAHGKGFPPGNLSVYGTPGQEVKLLDGVFLAVRSQTLHAHDLRFDERFDFHFYDMDFCRSTESKGLRMGTWGIPLVHESGGQFNSPAWQAACQRYFEKWGQ